MHVPREEKLRQYKWYYFIHIAKTVYTFGLSPVHLRLLRRDEVLYYRRQPLTYRLLVKTQAKLLREYVFNREGFLICNE